MQLNKVICQSYTITEEDVIHFNKTREHRRMIIMDSEGNSITLTMDIKTFIYIKDKMINLQKSIRAKEYQNRKREEAKK